MPWSPSLPSGATTAETMPTYGFGSIEITSRPRAGKGSPSLRNSSSAPMAAKVMKARMNDHMYALATAPRDERARADPQIPMLPSITAVRSSMPSPTATSVSRTPPNRRGSAVIGATATSSSRKYDIDDHSFPRTIWTGLSWVTWSRWKVWRSRSPTIDRAVRPGTIMTTPVISSSSIPSKMNRPM